jgi:ferrous iron transport protein A
VVDWIPLHMLPSGQVARIRQVFGGPDLVHRLEELGLRRDAEIEMIKPGSPCIIKLSGHKLCFRADELLKVLVQPGEMASGAVA